MLKYRRTLQKVLALFLNTCSSKTTLKEENILPVVGWVFFPMKQYLQLESESSELDKKLF